MRPHRPNQGNTMPRLPLALPLVLLLASASVATCAINAAETNTITSGVTLVKDDAEFVTNALLGGMVEIKTSELALKRNVTGVEREFAQTMVADHTKAITELKILAGAKGVAVPTMLDEKMQKKVDELGKENDTNFPAAFLEVEVDAHKKAVSAYKDASKDAKDSEVKAFAAKHLPHLEEHLAKAKALAKSH
jgi:putative membrane protein